MGDGRQLLQAIKKFATSTAPSLSIPVGTPVRALLRPVATAADRQDPEDVRRLSEWRNRFVGSFLTEFVANDIRTSRWLATTVANDDGRILFMADDVNGKTFAYIGLAFIDWGARSGEADAVVRGGDAPRGVMTEALQTLMSWARSQLGLERLGVRVRGDNPALEFYRKASFVERSRVPLRRMTAGDEIHWVEDPSADPAVALVHMEYVR